MYNWSKEKFKEARERRKKRVYALLGGKCVWCSAVTVFHIDHIDPATKKFHISENWLRKWSVLMEELSKCQLLCVPCHTKKSLKEQGGPPPHGSRNSYCRYKCRCSLCKTAMSVYQKQYYKKKHGKLAER